MSPVYLNGVEQVVTHATRHQDGGADEVSVTALSGELADRQLSKAGASTLGWTNLKLLRGAGVGSALTEIDVPTGVTTFAALTDVKVVRKTANETVSNDTTLQNDNELLFAIGANEVWEFILILFVAIKAASDFKSAWSLPAGASGRFNYVNTAGTGSDLVGGKNDITASRAAISGVDENYIIFHVGIIINGANAGNAQLQWAQNAAVVENTVVETNSCIIAHKLA